MARPRNAPVIPDTLLEAMGIDPAVVEGMSPAERETLLRCVEEYAETGTSPTAQALVTDDYKWEPVSMQQFLDDPFYLGKIAGGVYPKLRELVIECIDAPPEKRPTEVIFGGSLGWGKTTGAALLAIYLLYRLTCLRDPHKYYGIMQGTELVIGVYSINIEQAMDGIYGRLLRWVDAIPYFDAKCPRVKRVTAEIRFSSTPIKVVAGSKEVHTMGRDMYCFVLDEANFFSKAGADNVDDVTIAQGIYTNAARRIKNRFMTSRGEPAGLAILASSKRTKASFLESHIKESQKEIASGKTKSYAYAVWDVLPATKYKKPRFPVEIGDRIHPSRILRDGEDARRGSDVIMVPGELRSDFELDVDKALRDHAGVASESMMPLFRDRTVLLKAATAAHKHPFTRPEITLNINDDIGIDTYFVPERMFSIQRSAYTLRLNPTAPRYLHVDIGFTEDSLGLCMLHIAGARTVKRARADGTWYEDRAPVCVVDFLLRVNPPQGEGEIDLPKVRSFVLALRDLGVSIARISYDSHQSRESVQVFKKLGFDAIWQSVDKTDQPYLDLRQAIIEQRIAYYEYPVLIRELGELERDLDENKVDHPKISSETGEKGSKDVADALAGAYFTAMTDKRFATVRNMPEGASGGTSVSSGRSAPTVTQRVQVPGGSLLWSTLDQELR